MITYAGFLLYIIYIYNINYISNGQYVNHYINIFDISHNKNHSKLFVDFRQDFIEFYNKIIKSGQFEPGQDKDASFIVLNYIKPGMSMRDAFDILSKAGFMVFPFLDRQEQNNSIIKYSELEKNSIIATMYISRSFISDTTVSVIIYPENLQEGIGVVGKVRARISTSSL